MSICIALFYVIKYLDSPYTSQIAYFLVYRVIIDFIIDT